MAYYLIDFENVKSRGMEGVELLTEEDTVCIFYSDNADSMTFDLHRKLNETKANIIYHKVAVGTKNALDFQLATYLGYLICEQQREGIHPNYFIVTKDNGFTSLMVYWKAQGVPVRIIRNLLWGKNPVAEQNLLTEEENETETVVTAAEDVAEQPQPTQPEPVEETKESAQPEPEKADALEEPTQPEPVEETQEPVQPEPEKADAPEESAQPEPETVDESAQPVKKPSRKKNNTRKKSAAKTDDKEKAEAIVTFMKYITSEESVKQLTLEGAVFLSPKLDMEDPDVQGTGGLLGEYLALNANAEESTVNIQRNLSTAANSKLPSLLEELALDRLTPDAFIEQLAAENK